MSKAVLASIQPVWCAKIASRMKSVEVRKNRPNLNTPFKVYIYCTSVKSLNLTDYVKLHRITGGAVDGWSCKVIGEFTCDWILFDMARENADRLHNEGLIPYDQILNYGAGKPLYGWHISDLLIYDEPKELDWFRKSVDCHPVIGSDKCDSCHKCEIKRPPQSWCYVEDPHGE